MEEVFEEAIFVADLEVLGDPALEVVEYAVELGDEGVAVLAEPVDYVGCVLANLVLLIHQEVLVAHEILSAEAGVQVGLHVGLAVEEVERGHRHVVAVLDFGDVARGGGLALLVGLGRVGHFEQVVGGELGRVTAHVARVVRVYKNSNVTKVRGVGCRRQNVPRSSD